MKLTGLYEFEDHTLVNVVFILPLSSKTSGKGRVLGLVALNSKVVIDMGIIHECQKACDFNVQLQDLFASTLDTKIICCSFMV